MSDTCSAQQLHDTARRAPIPLQHLGEPEESLTLRARYELHLCGGSTTQQLLDPVGRPRSSAWGQQQAPGWLVQQRLPSLLLWPCL